jgi:2-iminobutanoate/2-iminopropanoate deaminase
VAGQLPIDLETGEVRLGTIEEQTELALGNIGRILEAAGSGLGQALQVVIYLANIEHWPAVNAVYARLFGEHRPARAVVPIKELHFGVGIEIVCTAAVAPARTAGRTSKKKPAPRRRGR